MTTKPRRIHLLDNKRRLLVRRNAVTIAAGFRFDEGILLCADTRHTGEMAFHESKIFPDTYPSGAKAVIAFAGSVRFARMAIQECHRRLSVLDEPTTSTMRTEIEAALIEFHKRHIYPHPHHGTVDGPDFYLMIGTWCPSEPRAVLYLTEQTAINEIDGFDCLGTGAYLGHYIIRPRYRCDPSRGMYIPLQRVILLATMAMMRIKEYDPQCGGNSEFVILRNDGEMPEVVDFNISESEKFSRLFYHHADGL